jgi:hypothetical protein
MTAWRDIQKDGPCRQDRTRGTRDRRRILTRMKCQSAVYRDSGHTARVPTRETPETVLEYEAIRLRAYVCGDESKYWGIL